MMFFIALSNGRKLQKDMKLIGVNEIIDLVSLRHDLKKREIPPI
jgi:hypothetical protein